MTKQTRRRFSPEYMEQSVAWLSRLGRKRGVVVRFEPRKDQGSHGRLHYRDRFNAVGGLRKEN